MRRVLHVIPSVGPLRGGPSMMVRQIAAALAQTGIDTHVACTNDNGPGILPVPCGVPVNSDGATYWYFPRQTRFYTFSWPLSRWLAAHIADFDVVHIHALFSYASLPASYWSHRLGVPYVVRPLGTLNRWGMSKRRPWLKSASFRLLESRIVGNAALMHYTSEQERAEAESLGIRTPSVVIPNPLPPPVRSVGSSDPTSPDPTSPPAPRGAFRGQHPALAGRPLVLFLSRIDAKKGVDLLLRAFVDVRKRVPGAALIIAGDLASVYAAQMQALAISLGVDADVVWPGFLSGTQKASALADADLFVLPSHSENFGIAVAEAMAAGLPVVVSDQVAIHGDVVAAEAGVSTRCDVAELADALCSLLAQPELCRTMGANGRRFASHTYSAEAVTRQLVQAYNGLLN